jgi:hypothetical protein
MGIGSVERAFSFFPQTMARKNNVLRKRLVIEWLVPE